MNTNQAIQYILSQTKENISFLQSTQQISQEDAREILSRLPNGTDTSISMNQAHGHAGPPPTKNSFSQLASRPPPPIPIQSITKAKAIWNYNENNAISTDLSFYAGDIVEITDDKNPDWWTGRLNGKEGLFPASYVEKLARDVPQLPARNHLPNTVDAKPPMPPNFPSASGPPPSGPTYGAPAPYQPHYQQQNSYYVPPPPQNGPYPPYQGGHNGPPPPSGPPPSAVAAPPQENQEQSGKKHGLFSGKLGNTLAHSAVGGVGFGAGSAVGSGIINSIF